MPCGIKRQPGHRGFNRSILEEETDKSRSFGEKIHGFLDDPHLTLSQRQKAIEEFSKITGNRLVLPVPYSLILYSFTLSLWEREG